MFACFTNFDMWKFKFILFLHNDHVCSATGDAADANLNNQDEQLAAQWVPEPAPPADVSDQGMLVMPFTYKYWIFLWKKDEEKKS